MRQYYGPVIFIISACGAGEQKLTSELMKVEKSDGLLDILVYLFVTADHEVAWQDAAVAWTVFYHQLSYAELRRIMGQGEAACLAMAAARGWMVASDERRWFRREAVAHLGEGRLVTTAGLLVLAIRAGFLSMEEADHTKAVLEQH